MARRTAKRSGVSADASLGGNPGAPGTDDGTLQPIDPGAAFGTDGDGDSGTGGDGGDAAGDLNASGNRRGTGQAGRTRGPYRPKRDGAASSREAASIRKKNPLALAKGVKVVHYCAAIAFKCKELKLDDSQAEVLADAVRELGFDPGDAGMPEWVIRVAAAAAIAATVYEPIVSAIIERVSLEKAQRARDVTPGAATAQPGAAAPQAAAAGAAVNGHRPLRGAPAQAAGPAGAGEAQGKDPATAAHMANVLGGMRH